MATPIVWTPEMSVQIDEIDEQHKKLIDIANRLLEKIKADEANSIISSIISDLHDYTSYHFETEEKYFIECGYKDAAIHAQQHAIFISKIKSFQRKFEKNDLEISDKVLEYLRKWFVDHIIGSDKKYVPLLTEKLK